MSDEKKAGDNLAAITFTPTDGEARVEEEQHQAEQAQQQMSEEQTLAMLEAGVQMLVFQLLKLGRGAMAKKLPPILKTWTDDVLAAPAQASVPLLRNKLDALMKIVAVSPEVAALVVACIPMVFGLMQAMEEHRRTIDMPATEAKQSAEVAAT